MSTHSAGARLTKQGFFSLFNLEYHFQSFLIFFKNGYFNILLPIEKSKK